METGGCRNLKCVNNTTKKNEKKFTAIYITDFQ
jgi:hypothetical protein